MTAAMLVLEPIFEADLPPEQYAYRAERNAQQAVVKVTDTLFKGHLDVVDADLADYFGSIPHAELMISLARQVSDRRVLHLIKLWLECAVEETDQRGRKKRPTEAKDIPEYMADGSGVVALVILALLIPECPTDWLASYIGILSFMSVISTAMCWWLWIIILDRVPAWEASLSVLGTPVVAIVSFRLCWERNPNRAKWQASCSLVVAWRCCPCWAGQRVGVTRCYKAVDACQSL